MIRKLIMWLGLVALPIQLAAQADPDSIRHVSDCRLARQVIETGQPAPHAKWARGYIPNCGSDVWGKATAAEVLRLRTSQDEETLDAVWYAGSALVDAALFRAAMQIAADRRASTPARIKAMLHLAMLNDPYIVIRYRELPKDFVEAKAIRARGGHTMHARHCRARKVLHGGKRPYTGEPLPPDAMTRIHELADQVQRDSSEPERLRVAASCITGRL